jgi:heme exporter protein C
MKLGLKTILLVACALGAAALFLVLPFMVLDAPLEQQLFFNQKIFYYHVPAAMLVFAGGALCGIASVGYLVTRKPAWDDFAAVGGDMAVVFGAIMMTTGPIWAKAAWGTWWVWDARLTTALLLWMIFLAYALIRRFGGAGHERLAAGVAIFGLVDIPLVYFAVNFWRTQHPTNEVIGTLPPQLRGVFRLAQLGYLLLFILFYATLYAIKRGERRAHDAHETAADLGLE